MPSPTGHWPKFGKTRDDIWVVEGRSGCGAVTQAITASDPSVVASHQPRPRQTLLGGEGIVNSHMDPFECSESETEVRARLISLVTLSY
jgi:hypothetical protein